MKTLNAALDAAKPRPSFNFAQRPKVRAAIGPSQLGIGNWKWPFLAALLLVPAHLFAQFSIDWYKVAGGGGTSTGGIYSVSGTIGQPDASGAMTGGNYSLVGGFWALYAVQTPGAPILSIKLTTTNTAMVYWPSPSTGYNLQVNTNLAPAYSSFWVTPPQTITDNGTIKYIIINPPTGNQFYRLKSP